MTRFRVRDLMEEARKKGKKITQTALAHAAGVSTTTIWDIVNENTKAPDPAILFAIAKVLSEALGRQLTIADLIEQVPSSNQNVDLERHKEVEYEDWAFLPLLGEIPCGDLRQVGEEHIIDQLPVPKWMLGPAQFILRAKGDSMSPTIEDGDLLMIEPGDRWNNNSIVIAWVDGEVTCKRLQTNNGYAVLVPENLEHKVIIVQRDSFIIGRVIGKYREFVQGWKP